MLISRKFQKDLCVSLTYIPPTSDINSAIDKLDQLGACMEKLDYEWVIGGDFNIDLSANCHTRAKRLLINFSIRYSLSQLISGKTRVSVTRASILDHIYTSNPDNVFESGVITYGMSDHHITFVNLKRNLPKKQKTSFRCRKMRGYDRSLQADLLADHDFGEFYSNNNPNECWGMLYSVYLKYLDKTVPFVELYNIKEADNWVSPELLKFVRDRDIYKSKADKISKNDSFIEFKRVRNKVKREVIRAKHTHVRNCLNDLVSSSKKILV